MTNITFDLETLGNTSNAPIVQIGAVKFLDNGEIIDRFNVFIDIESLQQYKNFVVTYSTVKWWMEQNDAAIKSVFTRNKGIDIKDALLQFSEWCQTTPDNVFWSHLTFDPPILINAFFHLDISNPMHFRSHRDIRTLTHLVGEINVTRVGTHHNALDDCLFQAAYVSKGLEIINNLKNNENE